MRIKVAIVLLVFTVISVGAWASMGQAQRGRSITYEYMVVPDETDSNRDEGLQKLDKLGARPKRRPKFRYKTLPETREKIVSVAKI